MNTNVMNISSNPSHQIALAKFPREYQAIQRTRHERYVAQSSEANLALLVIPSKRCKIYLNDCIGGIYQMLKSMHSLEPGRAAAMAALTKRT